MATTQDVKVGPWGGPAGNYAYEFKPKGKIIKIYVRSGECIDSIIFGYLPNGSDELLESDRYGGDGGGAEQVMFVDPVGEEIIELSGTISIQDGSTVITSLTFKTTEKNTVFGSPRGEKFSLPVKVGKFVGFHGRYGDYLDSIGAILVHK